MSCPKYTLLVAVSIFLAADVRAWDVSVVTPLQIHFLTRNADENLIENKLKEMGAIAYNPITNDIYVSDSNAKEGSIFRIKTTGDAAFSVVEPIVVKQNESVQALAFDYHTSKLYWTDGSGHTIRVVRVPENMTKVPLPGKVLHSFKDQIPQGLAIDVCRGYLYWTNSYHKNATIERSFLNGTGREVLINETLYQPFAIAVDVEHNQLYWSDEREGMFYNIDSMDLNAIGAGRRRLISGAHNRPFAMALDERYIYWSDWTNDAVWTLPKDSFGGGVEPIQLAKYATGPMALMTPAGNTTVVNSTYCAMHRAKDIAESTKDAQPDLIPYEVLRNICKNKGVLHMNGTCTCVPGFAGEFCQESACHGYCRSGACTLTGSGEPTCQCPENTTGVRCEVPLCALPCENNGKCTLDPSGFSTCKCPDGYSGDVCQYTTLIMELCKSHCADTTVPESQKIGVCRCEKSTDTEDYNSVRADMVNHSDVSPCKISKSMFIVISILTVLVASLGVLTMILARKVRSLGRRPRIKKRIVVNKSITPLTHSRQQPDQNQQCEITIENCCNMNICETPCFEPNYRPTPKIMIPSLSRSKKEDKTKLLSISDMSSEDEKPVVRP